MKSIHKRLLANGIVPYWPLSDGWDDEEWCRWDKVVAIIAGLVTSEYAATVVPQVYMMLPLMILIPVFFMNLRYFDWPYGIFWLIYSFILIGIAMLSTLAASERELRGLVFAISCFSPFILLAFTPRPTAKFMKLFCCVALIRVGWVYFNVLKSGEIGPWTLPPFPGFNGAHLNMLWPLLMALSLNESGSSKTMLRLLGVAAMIATFLVFSRAGLYILISTACILLARKNTRLFFVVVFLVVTTVLLAPGWLVERFYDFLAWYRIIDYESENPRSLIWGIAEQVFQNHLFWGVGPGNAKFYLYGAKQYYEAHNLILHVALENGAIAGFLMAVFLIYLVILVVRLVMAGNEGPFIAVALSAFVVQSMAEAYTNQPAQIVMTALTVAYGRSLLRRSRAPDGEICLSVLAGSVQSASDFNKKTSFTSPQSPGEVSWSLASSARPML